MTYTPFNAKGSFDLGRLNNLFLLSNSDISDKILVLKHDTQTGKYYLSPQSQISENIQYQDEIVIGSGKSYFHKSTFVANTKSNDYKTIKSYTIPVPTNRSNKSKIYLSLDIDLYGKSSDTDSNEFYNFTTGYNVISSSFNTFASATGDDPTQPDCVTTFGTDCECRPGCKLCIKTNLGLCSLSTGKCKWQCCCQDISPPPVQLWGCSGSPNYNCVQSYAGTYNTQQECASSCVAPLGSCCTTSINGGKTCLESVSESYCTSLVTPSGPVVNSEFFANTTCSQITCVTPDRWSCTGSPNYSCIKNPSGAYSSEIDCLTSCVAPTGSCCITSSDGSKNCTAGVTEAYCTSLIGGSITNTTFYVNKVCADVNCRVRPPVKWTCTGDPGYLCVSGSSGPFNSKADCETSCKAPPPIGWSCVADPDSDQECTDKTKCIQQINGEFSSEEDCYNSCSKFDIGYNSSSIGISGSSPAWATEFPIDRSTLTYDYKHIPGSFTVLMYADYNKIGTNLETPYGNLIPVMFGAENRHPYYEDVIKNKIDDQLFGEQFNQYLNNILVLQPNYSTLNNPISENKNNIKHYPIVTSSINNNGDLVLTIRAKSLQYSNEQIHWFGKVEIFVSIT